MSKAAATIALLAVCLAGCSKSEPEQGTLLEQTLADTVEAPETTTASDTTLQPVVALTLRAIGNTDNEIRFDQDTLNVKAGALVNLTLINEGTELTMIHNFVLTTKGRYKEVAVAGAKVSSPKNYVPDSRHVLAATPLALPGQTVEHEFKAPPPGTYSFVCTYPQHWSRMHGTLIVTE